MKAVLCLIILLAVGDLQAAARPAPPRQPTIIVDTHDLYPEAAPPWWALVLRYRYFWRFW